MLIKLDPYRDWKRRGVHAIPPTGIPFRAYNGSLNRWDNYDLAELDRDSLLYVLTVLWGVRENVARLCRIRF